MSEKVIHIATPEMLFWIKELSSYGSLPRLADRAVCGYPITYSSKRAFYELDEHFMAIKYIKEDGTHTWLRNFPIPTCGICKLVALANPERVATVYEVDDFKEEPNWWEWDI
jgi:hypothetical protein